MGVTRRSVLGFGLVAALPARVVATAATGPAVFVGQAGQPQSGRLVLGLLATADEASLRAAVSELRQKLSYRRVLRSRSTDRYKVAFARELLDMLMRRSDTAFSAIEFELTSWPGRGGVRDRLVADAAGELFTGIPAGTPVSLIDNGDGANFGTLVRAVSAFRPGLTLRYGLIGDDDLLQVASFLAGLADPSRAKARSAKGELVAHLKLRLGVGDVSARTLTRNPRFALRSVRL